MWKEYQATGPVADIILDKQREIQEEGAVNQNSTIKRRGRIKNKI